MLYLINKSNLQAHMNQPLLHTRKFYILLYLLIFFFSLKISADYSCLSPKTIITDKNKHQFIKELSLYPQLFHIVQNSPHVFNALLSDPTLKPVFLVNLSQNRGEVGRIENIAPDILDEIGGESLIDKHTGFYAGHFERAEAYLKKGYRLTVGVTDRAFAMQNNPLDTNITFQGVANARTVFFPLYDGTWLSVKGSGLFKDNISTEELPYIIGDIDSLGLFHKYELSGIAIENEKLKDAFLPQTLAIREIFKLPDNQASLTKISDIDEFNKKDSLLVLLFKRVATPHRFVKIYQLGEHNINVIRKNISKALISLNRLKQPFKNNHAWFKFIIKWWGKNEAYKFNKLIIASSLHSQDMQLGGADEDTSELFELNQDLKNLELDIYYPEIFNLIKEELHLYVNKEYKDVETLKTKEHILLLTGIYQKLQSFIILFSNNEKKSPVPDSPEERFSYFENLFKGFFETIKSDNIIEKWLFTAFDIKDKYGVYLNPLQAILSNKKYSFSVFHKEYDKNEPRYITSEQKTKREGELLKNMHTWLWDEYSSRHNFDIQIAPHKTDKLLEMSS